MSCKFIYIYKGDDTNWNNEQFVTINVTPAEGSEIDLTDMKAKFILGSYSKEYDLTTGSFAVDLTAATTDIYAFGPINGIVRVYDTQNRVKTITNTIPFYVTDQVIAEQHQSLDLEVPEGSSVDINVTVGGQVSYNDLTDKPSINGVTVEGDKSGYDYGLADEAGLALKVSKSGDTMSGNLVLEQGVGIETTNAEIHEVNNKLVLGNKSNNYGLYVNPNGTGAAFVSSQGNADVLKSTDLRNTYDPNSTYPITGQGVSQAISSKQDTITGAATTITSSNLSANKALISDNNGKVAASTVTSTELGYVSGVTSAIQTQINNEVSARTNADLDLQGQIDAISAASDVTDIVGTYAELQAYDTQHLKDNDIIKVLTDSTHDNASTYYRWSMHTQTFTYIGAEGPYYTKAEADTEFLSQANAATTYLTQANAASTYATQTALTNGLATKASSADGVTITDSGSAISTVAVKEQRASTAIKQWVGTKEQYTAIDTKDPDTVYIITDETDVEAITVDSALSSTSIHPVQNKVIYDALANKQTALMPGANVQINSNVISATDTTYTQGAGITFEGTEINANADYSDFLIPDTTNMKVLKTFNYTVSSSSTYYTFATILNNISQAADFRLSTLFRMTITGTGINSVVECMISTLGLIGDGAYLVARNTQDSYTAGASGVRYMRMISPKTANSGYDYAFELSIYNNVDRNIKLEVLKDDSRINWLNSLTATTYNSTYQVATPLTVYTNKGISVSGTPNMTVSGANSAGSISNNLPKGLGTQPSAGEALVTGLVFTSNDGKMYQATNTVQPIRPDWGVQYCSAANVAVGSAPGVSSLRQKTSSTIATLRVSSETVAAGDGMYLRCTMSGGEIYSDNYIYKTPSAGYTWYYLGYAFSDSNMNFDTTQSFFFTLDANGKLTHVNGKQINGGVPTLTWYTGNTGTTVTVADTSTANLVKIYKNGILLEPTADYSISGTTLTLVTALVSTDKITTEVF